jgi:hypothetical protein
MPCKDITIEEAKLRFQKKSARLNIPETVLGQIIKHQDIEYEVLGLGYRIRQNGLVVKDVKTGEIHRLPISIIQVQTQATVVVK